MSGRSVVVSLVLVVVVAIAAAAGWKFLRQGTGASTAPVVAKSTVPANAAAKDERPAPAVADSLKPSRTPATAPVAPKHDLTDDDEVNGGSLYDGVKKIPIDGVVIVTDAQGLEHGEESGTLAPQFFDPPRADAKDAFARSLRVAGPGKEVSVTASHFHVEVPEGRGLGVGKLVLGGRPALFEGEPIEIAVGQPVTIRARWIDGVRLHVIDATTRVDLDEVTVARVRDHLFSISTHPGDAAAMETVVDHAASPLVVAPRDVRFGFETRDTLFVRAAGHAWGRVDLNYAQTTEATVELGPAATLVVSVQGELPHRAPPPRLCLREPSHDPSFDDQAKEALAHFDEAKAADFPGGKKPTLEEFKRMIEQMRGQYEATRNLGRLHTSLPAVLGETRMESLTPGEFVVSVELGDEARMPLVAGKSAVKLVAGETAHVTLVLTPVTAPEPAPLAGTLFVPAGWKTKELRLKIVPLDLPGKTDADERRIALNEMVALPGRTGWFHWSAGDVLPATYEFEVDGASFSHAEKIGPSGNDHVELTLAEPATLIVHTVDAASGQPVELKFLNYTAASGELRFGDSSPVRLDYEADHARYTAVVPVGAGALDSFGDQDWTLDEAPTPVEIHAGSQEITLRVHRACGVLVALSCGGAKIAWPEDLGWECTLEPVDDKGKTTWTTTRDDLPCLAVAVPGKYRVTLPEIPGFAPVEPFEVDVPAGEFVKRTVELTRK